MRKTFYFGRGENSWTMSAKEGVQISLEQAKKGICTMEWKAKEACSVLLAGQLSSPGAVIKQGPELEGKTRVRAQCRDGKIFAVLDLEAGDKVELSYQAAEALHMEMGVLAPGGAVTRLYESKYGKEYDPGSEGNLK